MLADGTDEVLFLFVNGFYVLLEAVSALEFFVAETARVEGGFVRHLMLVKILWAVEGLVTSWATVRFLESLHLLLEMRLHCFLHLSLDNFCADFTNLPSLTAVNLMVAQFRVSGEDF